MSGEEWVRLMEATHAEIFSVSQAEASAWMRAPLPLRFHRCVPTTTALLITGRVERCACGGIRLDGGMWLRRNSRSTGRALARLFR